MSNVKLGHLGVRVRHPNSKHSWDTDRQHRAQAWKTSMMMEPTADYGLLQGGHSGLHVMSSLEV